MLPPETLVELGEAIGTDRIDTEFSALLPYASDASFAGRMPDAVAHPSTTEAVSRLMRVVSSRRINLVPRGSGTSLTGGPVPLTGGLVLDLAGMNQIIEIDRATSTATVQAGVRNGDLQRAAAAYGLFYPPDPASWETCTLGGNVACNAGGPRCLKYGVTKSYVLGLVVVLVDGRVLRLGGKLLKNATGYQLLQLFIGSEGTLGVITEIILRLLPLPTAYATAAVQFASLEDASVAVTEVLSAGLLPAKVELMDHVTLSAVEDALHLGLPAAAGAVLLIEQDGTLPDAVDAEITKIAEICRRCRALDVQVATASLERDKLWTARRAASDALARLRPNKTSEDIVVPRSQIPQMVQRIGEIAASTGLVIAVFGHAGDGNLHPTILFDRTLPGEMERVEQAVSEIFRASLELGGTLSGEHGIGALKRAFLRDAVGDESLALMAAIKQLFDPSGLLNPGKVLAPTGASQVGFLTDLPVLDSFATG
ncbi:MAG: FAD-binding oxidoreductase [Ktedonobacterales bacterium]